MNLYLVKTRNGDIVMPNCDEIRDSFNKLLTMIAFLFFGIQCSGIYFIFLDVSHSSGTMKYIDISIAWLAVLYSVLIFVMSLDVSKTAWRQSFLEGLAAFSRPLLALSFWGMIFTILGILYGEISPDGWGNFVFENPKVRERFRKVLES